MGRRSGAGRGTATGRVTGWCDGGDVEVTPVTGLVSAVDLCHHRPRRVVCDPMREQCQPKKDG